MRIRRRFHLPRGEVTVALLSLIVSLVVLATAYESQVLDRFYREAAIKPLIVFSISEDGNKLEVRNDGLGSADIDRIDYTGRYTWAKHPKRGYYDGNDENFAKAKELTISNINRFIEEIVGIDLNPEENVKAVDWNVYALPAAQKRTLFEVDKAALLNKLKALKKDDYIQRKDKIENLWEVFSDRVNIRSCYCSVTGFFCTETLNRFKEEYDSAKEENRCTRKYPSEPGSILGIADLFRSRPIDGDENKFQ